MKEEQNFEPIDDDEDEKNVRSSSGTESASFPSYSYSMSSGDEPFLDKQDLDEESSTRRKDAATTTKSNVKIENPKRRSIHQDVLMASALAAVMETSEDNLVWFDEVDRNSLLSEPGEIARNRIARMREISRSEGSLFNEHGNIEVDAALTTAEDTTEKEAIVESKPRLEASKAVEVSFERLEPVALRRSSKVLSTPFKRGHSRSKSDQIGVSKPVIEEPSAEDGPQEDKLSMSAPNATFEENSK